MADNWLFVTWSWRGAFEMFPNAKLYEAAALPAGNDRGHACPECEKVYEKWLSFQSDGAT